MMSLDQCLCFHKLLFKLATTMLNEIHLKLISLSITTYGGLKLDGRFKLASEMEDADHPNIS